MAHYAFLDQQNIVTEVIVGIDENQLIEDLDPEIWYGNFRNQKCVRTSYNHRIRKQFASQGYFYDQENDVFIRPQPFPSWHLDANFDWQPPIPMPNQGDWIWNESEGAWKAAAEAKLAALGLTAEEIAALSK